MFRKGCFLRISLVKKAKNLLGFKNLTGLKSVIYKVLCLSGVFHPTKQWLSGENT